MPTRAKKDGTIYKGAGGIDINHAEQDVLGKISDEIDKNLNDVSLSNTMKGKIYIYIDNKLVCSNCTANAIDNLNHQTIGPLKLFSDEFPNIEVIIKNNDLSKEVNVFRGKIERK